MTSRRSRARAALWATTAIGAMLLPLPDFCHDSAQAADRKAGRMVNPGRGAEPASSPVTGGEATPVAPEADAVRVPTTLDPGRVPKFQGIPCKPAPGAETDPLPVGRDVTAGARSASKKRAALALEPTQLALESRISAFGAELSLQARLTLPDGRGVPDEPVLFWVAGRPVGETVTDLRGNAALESRHSALTPGSHAMRAEFPGNADCRRSLADASLKIVRASTRIELAAAPAGLVKQGSPVRLHGKLVRTSNDRPVSGATILASVEGDPEGSAITDEGKFWLTVPSSSPNAEVRFRYEGDAYHLGSEASLRLPWVQRHTAEMADVSGRVGERVDLRAKIRAYAGVQVRFEIRDPYGRRIKPGPVATTDANGIAQATWEIDVEPLPALTNYDYRVGVVSMSDGHEIVESVGGVIHVLP